MSKIPLIVVAGPTASGKTSLAIEIAKNMNGEIVSADSMQIYKYMDIGTAKPTSDEQAMCKHHLIDFAEPDCDFSVADYTRLAHRTIADIVSRGKTPVMCGGTGLYINSVVNDIDFDEEENNCEIRRELNEFAEKNGAEALYEMLCKIDSEAAANMHKNNVKRVIRAIEYYRLTGEKISEHNKRTQEKVSRYSPVMFMINHERSLLYERINKRVDIMMDEGLLEEVQKLRSMGFSRSLNSMQGIGYKEFLAYIDGECSLSEAVEVIKQNSRRYAKRQLTWFRREERINLLSAENAAEEAIKIIKG